MTPRTSLHGRPVLLAVACLAALSVSLPAQQQQQPPPKFRTGIEITPVDVTVAELALECFFPADAATMERLRGLAASYGSSIVKLVSETIRSWDARTITARLEAAVGRPARLPSGRRAGSTKPIAG